MSTVDIVVAGQSNCFQTDTRTAAANLIQQPDVPAWYAMQLGVGTDLRLRVIPWQGIDCRYRSVVYNSSRQWVGTPEAMVRRLVDTYGHRPRLIHYAVGASRFADQWPDAALRFTAQAQQQIQEALASSLYPGTPARRFIVIIHGESDAQALVNANAYDTYLGTVVTALRTTLGDANTHTVVVQLSTNQNVGGTNEIATVRTKQAAWVTAQGGSKATLIDSTPYAISADNIHRSQAGAKALGDAIADVIAPLIP